jgi:hypothetical protein
MNDHLPASDSGPTPRSAKSDFLSVTMSVENLGEPLTGVYTIPGGQARLYERGVTVNGVIVSFAFPMIGRPKRVLPRQRRPSSPTRSIFVWAIRNSSKLYR